MSETQFARSEAAASRQGGDRRRVLRLAERTRVVA
jgi:hypothetical protein